MDNNTHGKVMKRKNRYITLDATPFRDTRLSWKAKGLMVYFLEKPEGWKFKLEHIYKQAPDAEKAVRSGINELKKYGYIVRVAFRKGNRVSHYEFLVYESPVAFPTEKDLHIDYDLWNQCLEENQDADEPVDVTLFAKHIKSLKKAQVSQNGKPQNGSGLPKRETSKLPENTQVYQNGKPQNGSGLPKQETSEPLENRQVCQKQHPAFAGLTTNKQNMFVVVKESNEYIPEEDIQLIMEEWEARFEETLTAAKFLQLKKSCLEGFEKIDIPPTSENVVLRILHVMECIDKYNRPFRKGALATAKSALKDNWEWGTSEEFKPVQPPRNFVPFDWVHTKQGGVR